MQKLVYVSGELVSSHANGFFLSLGGLSDRPLACFLQCVAVFKLFKTEAPMSDPSI